MPEILRTEGLRKEFPGVVALDNVDLSIEKGEVHALVGENGAGKSTFLKIIGGVYSPTKGKVYYKKNEMIFSNPLEAINSGISIVHQELSLFPKLSVAQNIFSHREPVNRAGVIKWDKLNAEAVKILDRIGVDIDPETKVEDLSVGIQQVVEIAKALSHSSNIIIFDEPTSALSEKEILKLYKVIKDLKERGVTILFVSHKLPEVFEISDRISVLRDGNLVGTRDTDKTNKNEIIKMMVGRELENLYPDKSEFNGDVIFSIKDLNKENNFNDISFDLKKGEILGFSGIVGSGRTEVARAIFGADEYDTGEIYLEDNMVEIKTPKEAIKKGICYLTEDRKDFGLFLEKSIKQNTVVASLYKHLTKQKMLNNKKIKKTTQKYIEYLNIKPDDPEKKVLNLSGGNQQKVLLAQWLSVDPKVLIVDEPTRGVDVGAKAEIHNIVRELANNGVAVIVISSELPEIIGLSDRIAVFNEGNIKIILDNKNGVEQEEIMKYAI